MADEILPPSQDDSSDKTPLMEKKSGMFRPVGEDPIPMPESSPVDGEPSMVVVEPMSTSVEQSPEAVNVPDNAPIPDTTTTAHEVASQIEQPAPVEVPPMVQETVSVSSVMSTPEVPSPDAPPVRASSGSGMGDPNTPSVTVVPPSLPVAVHKSSRTRILLIIVFLGALGFLGYKYRFQAPIDVTPPTDLIATGTEQPTDEAQTGVEVNGAEAEAAQGEEAAAAAAATGEVVPENSGSAPTSDGLQTFGGDTEVSFQYPQGWEVKRSEIDGMSVLDIFDDSAVLQAKLVLFGTVSYATEFDLFKSALDAIRLSEKPFMNETIAGTIGVYSGSLPDTTSIPTSILSVLTQQPLIMFQDKAHEKDYIVILQPNMNKAMFTVIRSLRLP